MKKQTFFDSLSFAKLGLAFALLLLLGSCQKEEAVSAQTEAPPNHAQLIKNGVNPPMATEPRCNCEYQIVNVTVNNQPTNAQFNYWVITEEFCVNNIAISNFSVYEGCNFAFDPNADSLSVPTPKPTAWYPFNCTQKFFSEFHTRLSYAVFTSADCQDPITNTANGTMSLRVRCLGGTASEDPCGTTWQTSDIIQIPFGAGMPLNPPPTVTLEGCGCTPTIGYDG